MAKVERFEELTCWQEARALTNEVYRMVGVGALAKDFRLRDQLTSASVSVMTNIAEGFARYHRRAFIRFLDIAQSSAAEVKKPALRRARSGVCVSGARCRPTAT